MEEFNGMSRATTREKTPPHMWEFGRNMVATKELTSVSPEEGFRIRNLIPGKHIGTISTNEHTVYFSIDGEFSCIGYTDIDNDATYIRVLRTTTLNFNIGAPIEGVAFYNYKGELIISFCDGTFTISNNIRLINLFNLGIDVDVNGELVNPDDIDALNLTIALQEGQVYISYAQSGILTQDIVYITYCYVLDDNISTSPFFPVKNIAYPTHNFREKDRRGINLQLTELDPQYNKIKLGILVNGENGLIAYQSNTIIYSGTSLQTSISSLTNYTTIAVESLVVPAIIYDKAESMTLQNNRLVLGGVTSESSTSFQFQKYANLLEVQPMFVDEDLDTDYEEDFFTHPTLCFDEVYSITIQPQLLNGQYLDAYHIPGRGADPWEVETLTNADLIAMGLEDLIGTDTYRRFRLINFGAFLVAPPYANSINHRAMRSGYWHNEDELYPNDEEFNSTVDYAGNPIAGGQDLRGTFKRHHRIPSLASVIEKIPCLIGDYYQNKHSNSYTPEMFFRGKIPRIGLRITNFNTRVPLEVRQQLQGFKINILRRTEGNRLVEDLCFVKQLSRSQQNVDGTVQTILTPQFRPPVNTEYRTRAEQFGRCVLYSSTFDIYKPSINAQLIKGNYAVRSFPNSSVPYSLVTFTNDIYKLEDTQRYAVINNAEYLPGNNIAAETLFTEEKVVITCRNNLQGTDGLADVGPNRWNPLLVTNSGDDESMTIPKWSHTSRQYSNITTGDEEDIYELLVHATILNLPKNIYVGFENNEFITLGRVSINNPLEEVYKNGDLFIANKQVYPMNIPWGTNINGVMRAYNFDLIGNFSVANNSEVYIEDERELREYAMNSGSETSTLATFQYTFDIFNEEVFRSLNDKATFIMYNVDAQFIDYFPYRVAISLAIQNENLQTNNIRTFPANSYYEMPNDKGKIIAVRGTVRMLYIQQKNSLFVATIKDLLTTREGVTYLGQGDIFDRIPTEIREDNKGYIGCTSKFACVLIPDYLVTQDQVKGKIFLIGNNGVLEISKANMGIWLAENWDIGSDFYVLDRNGDRQRVDNPYNSVGQIVGYDDKYGRLLFTKKFFVPKDHEPSFTFDGQFYYEVGGNLIPYTNTNYFTEESITLSFNLEGDKKVWLFDHDYFPVSYFWNNRGLFTTIQDSTNARTWQHNYAETDRGNYYSIPNDCYIDIIFNSRHDLVKWYKNITWTSTAHDINALNNPERNTLYNKTINAIAVYNNYQCSGEILLEEFTNMRNREGVWSFNEFRDIVINKDATIINKKGVINTANLNNNKSWFEKSNFISTFIVVRLIVKAGYEAELYINQVNVESRISQR